MTKKIIIPLLIMILIVSCTEPLPQGWERVKAGEMEYNLFIPQGLDTKGRYRLVVSFLDMEENGVFTHEDIQLYGQMYVLSLDPVKITDPVKQKVIIDHVIKNRLVEGDKIYLTGISEGGDAVWRLLAEYPGYFATVANTEYQDTTADRSKKYIYTVIAVNKGGLAAEKGITAIYP